MINCLIQTQQFLFYFYFLIKHPLLYLYGQWQQSRSQDWIWIASFGLWVRHPLRSQGLIGISHWTNPMQANTSSRGQTDNTIYLIGFKERRHVNNTSSKVKQIKVIWLNNSFQYPIDFNKQAKPHITIKLSKTSNCSGLQYINTPLSSLILSKMMHFKS